MNEKEVKKYITKEGKIPFDMWYEKLDKAVKVSVLKRIERTKIGLYGKHKVLNKGITELKFENGLRTYFSEIDGNILLLLVGGNKTRQSNDIKKAQEYLQDYIERTKND